MFHAPKLALPEVLPGYLPERYAGKTIKLRVPYTMPGELVVANAAVNTPFPDATFLQTNDLVFEIWSVSLHASQSAAAAPFVPIAEPAPGINKFWRIRMEHLSLNQNITKAANLVATLVDSDDSIWWWNAPIHIVRAEGFNVSVDNLLPAGPNALRAEINFRGYLCVIEPASETR